ncbi:MAG: magnesium-translocating P-type ATPase [Polyangiales bacterium]
MASPDDVPEAYWTRPPGELLAALRSGPAGLTPDEAARRLVTYGPNALTARAERGVLAAFLDQLRNPLAWLLLFAAVVSSFAREWTDAAVVATILLASAAISTAQERRASNAVEALRSRVALRAKVVRGGVEVAVDATEVVPGDVLALAPGALVAADAVVLDARDLETAEAVLTGETFPVEKSPDPSTEGATLSARRNVVFHGTSVRGGTGRALVVRTGAATEYGRVAGALALRAPETDFERGVRRFGHLLTRVMLVLVVFSFAATVLAHKPPVDSLLFAIALAVGLAPEMLPAVIAINLSHGARAMAERGVIVRRLAAIENFGAMEVLCTDKTGTLTEGTVGLDRALDVDGAESPAVLALAALNARLQAGPDNPLDAAIVAGAKARDVPVDPAEKLDEVAYDFTRRRLTVVVRDDVGGGARAVTKGAFAAVLGVCDRARRGAAEVALDEALRTELTARAQALGEEGLRVLGVATRGLDVRARYGRDDERGMVFEGLVTFADPPKPGAAEALASLASLGVRVKVITGDGLAVASHLARQIGLPVEGAITGAELQRTRDEALWNLAARTTIFAEVDPTQKERIILALRKRALVVGYMGDGINDAPALHAADVGVSVDGAADVAREAADFVLLRRDLGVLRDGIVAGRATFANTLKYIFTTESANFGNMLSMAAAAAFLPFLPLTASQVLLNNFLSDVPAMTIGTDAVDPDQLARPRRWNLRELRDFMVAFGAVSSAFDLLTFAALYWVVGGPAETFRTGWFLESLLTEVAVALVVRTRRRFYQSRPSRLLAGTSVAVALAAVALPYTPVARPFGLVPLAPATLGLLVAVTAAYVLTVEAVKQRFFRRFSEAESPRSG